MTIPNRPLLEDALADKARDLRIAADMVRAYRTAPSYVAASDRIAAAYLEAATVLDKHLAEARKLWEP